MELKIIYFLKVAIKIIDKTQLNQGSLQKVQLLKQIFFFVVVIYKPNINFLVI